MTADERGMPRVNSRRGAHAVNICRMWTCLPLLLFLTDLIAAPATVPEDRGTIVVSAKGGGRRWSANWTMEPASQQGMKAVRFTEQGKGRISPFEEEVQWSLEALWSAESGFRPLSSEKNVSKPDGTLLMTEKKQFDPGKNQVRFERRFSDGRMETKTLSVPADTLAVEGIAGILRFLPFDRGKSHSAHLLSNEPRVYDVTFELRGTERVRTPAGEFEAYRVEMVPHLGLLNVVRPFLPKAFFWFNAAAPHFWVRYEGPENGPGTPEIVMELDSASGR
jgi:hypothetical protein